MAPCKTLFLFNFFFSIIANTFPLILNDQNPQFHVFYVSASIAKTRNLLYQKPSQQVEDQVLKTVDNASAASSNALSVPLHPRLSLSNQLPKSYHNVTLSTLARDSVRVRSVTTRLQLGLSNFTHPNRKPNDEILRPDDLELPVTSGLSQGIGEYFARIGVGQPAKSYYVILDTGSDITWIQCNPCSPCFEQSDPIFNPSASTTYHPLQCSSPECNSLENPGCSATGCLYQVAYGDGSYTVGDLAAETLTFGDSGRVENVAIGCGHDNEGIFTGSAGILGIGGGPLSLPSQIMASSFSYCLVNRDSTTASTLEFNSTQPIDSVVATLIRNPTNDVFFYVDLVGISIAGKKLPIPTSAFQLDRSGRGGVILDSGTSVTRLKTQAYNKLRDTFLKYTQNLPKTDSYDLFDTCYDLSSVASVNVPKVAFLFSGGQSLTLNVENYLMPVNENGKFCLAFAATPGSINIIGNVQQQSIRVFYDLANMQIAFSPNKC